MCGSKVTGRLARLRKFDVRPHRGQTPVGSQLSGGVSGFGVLLNPLIDMVAPAMIAVVGDGAQSLSA
jgi:hypothetical protein